MNTQMIKITEEVLRIVSRTLVTTILSFVLFQACSVSCFAATVALQWDPVTESDLGGYKVYYQPNSISQPFQGTTVDVKNQTATTISNLDPNNAYSFAVTAYNTSGVESPYSNIVTVPEMVSPTTSISSPAGNASVSGMVTVSASASDNIAVTKVEFYVNGVVQDSVTTSPYVFSWNTATLSVGSYTLMTKAYDAAGNVGKSSSVVVTVVNDTIAPTVSLTSPVNGSTLSGITAITATANDNIGVSKVEFYKNGVLLAATNVAPYRFDWNTASVANGLYALSAKAYDARGNVGQTSKVSVTVSNDSTAPTVSITSPAKNAKVAGTVTVKATASDNVRVTGVEFYVDGTLKSTDTVSPFSFSWDTKTSANGSHTLMAKAYDVAGNTRASSVVVTVFNDVTAPTVTITSPVSGSTVSGSVTVKASAGDNVRVSKVMFYINGTLKASDTKAPYSFNWNTKTATNGSYTLTASAYDTAGNVQQSTGVMVTVKK